MPTLLKLSNAAADPVKWDSSFKAQLTEAGDPKFATHQAFSTWWKKGLSAVFLPPLGADLELTIDGDAKKFSWLVKPKNAAACNTYLATHTDLKVALKQNGVVAGIPANAGKEPAAKKEPEEEPENEYVTLVSILDRTMSAVDNQGKAILEAIKKKVQEGIAKKADIASLKTLTVRGVEKAKQDTAERKKNPAFGVTPPNAEELAKQREAAEIKFRKDQREAQKAAEKRKAEEGGTAQAAPAEAAPDPNRWVPTVRNLPLYGRLSTAQQDSVRSKLEDFNDRGGGGGAHVGVGGVVTLDLTGPVWGGTGRGDWRLQINTGGRSLNIVNHAGKTWNG